MRLSNLPQRCTLLLWLFSVFISFLIRILFVFSVLFRVFSVPGLVLLPFLYSLLPSSFASAFLLLLLSPLTRSLLQSVWLFSYPCSWWYVPVVVPSQCTPFSPRGTTSSVSCCRSWWCWCCYWRCRCSFFESYGFIHVHIVIIMMKLIVLNDSIGGHIHIIRDVCFFLNPPLPSYCCI